MTREQIAALLTLADGVVEAIEEAGEQGVPAGLVYSAFMAHGVSLENFTRLMNLLVDVGLLKRSGHLYFAIPRNEVRRTL